jgi:Thiol:disulfide interchange protein DsbD, N-terminal
VDQNGVVKSKYFEDLYSERYSAPTIWLREFGSVAGTRQTTVKNAHLELDYYSTRDVIRPGLRVTLVADFQLPPKMHVYAPEVKNYIPIRLELDASPNYKAMPAQYPKSEVLYLPAIQETVPVYKGKFRVTQDITAAGGNVLQPIIAAGGQVKITGKLRYQACDDKICYLPETLPLEWTLKVEPLDRERVPEPIQHKPAAAGER